MVLDKQLICSGLMQLQQLLAGTRQIVHQLIDLSRLQHHCPLGCPPLMMYGDPTFPQLQILLKGKGKLLMNIIFQFGTCLSSPLLQSGIEEMCLSDGDDSHIAATTMH